MRREAHWVAVVLLSLFPEGGVLAERQQQDTRGTPPPAPNPLSEALCGRAKDPHTRDLVDALKKFDPAGGLPSIWREMKIKTFQLWMQAQICPGSSADEANAYMSHHRVLEQIERRLRRAELTEEIGSLLAQFRNWRSTPDDWPRSSDCGSCATLRTTATRVAEIASRWPVRTSAKLGPRLDEATQREPLMAELCDSKPPRGMPADVERRFRYYSWTAGAQQLFKVAEFFEQPAVVSGCRG